MNKAMLLAMLVTPLVSSSVTVQAPPPCPPDCATRAGANGDAALQLYAQALARISEQAVFGADARAVIVGQTLAAYLATKDPYSGFLTPSEYAAFTALQNNTYAGIGAELERRRDGETLCYPFPGSPAERAGIKAGDRLLSIGGQPVKGKPLAVIAAWTGGLPGTQVMLEVAGENASARRIGVTRELVNPPALSEYITGGARIIRLSGFTSATPGGVEAILAHWPRELPVIIDLRGCGGGDFYAAVDTVMLFLNKGQPIVTVTGRDGAQPYISTRDGVRLATSVFLWQDEHTASAAELFIGALTDNARATSIGRTSAGKGSRQDILPLSNGAALILTTGYLSTPHGVRIDGHGLAPQRPVVAGAGTAVYLQATGAKG